MARRLNQAEEIISLAKTGSKLTTDQRRHAVGYLMATQQELTNMQMAELFDVSDRTIRDDKGVIRKQAAELVSQEDIGMVIADIRLTYEQFRQKLAASLKKATAGTATYLNHLKLEMEMQLRVVEALQSLGWYPKNLGELTKKSWSFSAIVTKDGTVDTRSVDQLDHIIQNPTSGEDDMAEREAEFEDVPSPLALTE